VTVPADEPASTAPGDPPAPGGPRRRRCCGCALVALLALAAAAYFLHPWLIPLPNASTHPWEAKLLIREVSLESALAFREVAHDFLIYDLFVTDPAFHAAHDLPAVRAEVEARYAAALEEARATAAAELEARAPDPERLANAARRILALGEIEEARDLLREGATRYDPDAAAGHPTAPRRLVVDLAEASLRLAETRNCIGHHAPESCLYPIRAGGVHVQPEPARDALTLYRGLAERNPDEVMFRWLLGVVAMTLGEDAAALGVDVARPTVGRAPFPRLTDVGAAAGLFGAETHSGGGVVLDDMDGDDDLDLLVGAYLPVDPLLYYAGQGDGTFVERTEAAGLTGQSGAFRLNQADVDNDGDLDVFVVRSGWCAPGRNSLLLNDGSGRFTDATAAAGLDAVDQSMAGAWADFDGDGWVDLFVANLGVLDTGPVGGPSRLYRNQGDGTFVEVTAERGLPELRLCGSAAWGDYDDDGDPDLYVSAAFGQNYLFRNDGAAGFTDVTWEAGVARPVLGFPTWFFDYDNDGRLDLFASSFWPLAADEVASLTGAGASPEKTPRLYRNRGDGTFADVTAEAGLDDVVVSIMGANAGDLDGDGFPDVYLGTGSPYLAHLVPNRLLHNQAGAGFADATFSADVGHLQKGHGVAMGDVDRDGDLDLVVDLGGAVPVDGFQPALFENPGQGRRWLEVRLVGTRSNRAAIGARISAFLPDGTRVHRQVRSGGSFGSSPLRQHLGLGDAERVARLEVRWPSGRLQVLDDVAVDRRIVVEEPAE